MVRRCAGRSCSHRSSRMTSGRGRIPAAAQRRQRDRRGHHCRGRARGHAARHRPALRRRVRGNHRGQPRDRPLAARRGHRGADPGPLRAARCARARASSSTCPSTGCTTIRRPSRVSRASCARTRSAPARWTGRRRSASPRSSSKQERPNWYPPKSVRLEHEAKGDPLPPFIPPGPDNPLGEYAMRLGIPGGSYLIHGTNRPAGVGMQVTHGCIRMFPEDIAEFYTMIPVNTKVNLVDQTTKVGWSRGTLFVERQAPLEGTQRSVAHGSGGTRSRGCGGDGRPRRRRSTGTRHGSRSSRRPGVPVPIGRAQFQSAASPAPAAERRRRLTAGRRLTGEARCDRPAWTSRCRRPRTCSGSKRGCTAALRKKKTPRRSAASSYRFEAIDVQSITCPSTS